MGALINRAALAALLSAATLTQAAPVTVLNDDFGDNSAAKTGALDAYWLPNDQQATTPSVVSASTGQLSFTAGAQGNKFVAGFFTSSSLVAEGDYITLSMKYQYGGSSPTTTDKGVRIGLVDSGATVPLSTATNVGNTAQSDVGYVVGFNPANFGTASNVLANITTYENSSTGVITYNSPTAAANTTSTTASPGTTSHDFTLTLLRLANGSLDITASLSGVFSNFTVNSGTSPLTTKFDQIFLREAGSVNVGPYLLDDVLVTTGNVVPEPTSLALAGVAGLGLLRRRR